MKNGTLNFKKEFKLWKACADDSFRPVLEHVLFKDGYAYASNSHILVRVPLAECTTFDDSTIELLDNCLIHKSMLKYIVGFDVVLVEKTDDGAVSLKAKAETNTITVQLGENGESLKYPDVEGLLQSKNDRTPIMQIGLDPKLVYSLTEALGTDLLKFEFSDERSAVFVTPTRRESQALGLVMPFMLP